MGAVTIANVANNAGSAGYRSVSADVTFSASYATGGDTFPIATLGLSQVYQLLTVDGTMADGSGANSASRVYVPNPHGIQVVLNGTPIAPTLKAFSGATTEVANATNLSTRGVVRLEFRGV